MCLLCCGLMSLCDEATCGMAAIQSVLYERRGRRYCHIVQGLDIPAGLVGWSLVNVTRYLLLAASL